MNKHLKNCKLCPGSLSVRHITIIIDHCIDMIYFFVVPSTLPPPPHTPLTPNKQLSFLTALQWRYWIVDVKISAACPAMSHLHSTWLKRPLGHDGDSVDDHYCGDDDGKNDLDVCAYYGRMTPSPKNIWFCFRQIIFFLVGCRVGVSYCG